MGEGERGGWILLEARGGKTVTKAFDNQGGQGGREKFKGYLLEC